MPSLMELRKRYVECEKHFRIYPATIAEVQLAYLELLTDADILIQRCYGTREGKPVVLCCGQLLRAINLKADIVVSFVRAMQTAGRLTRQAHQKSCADDQGKSASPTSVAEKVSIRG